MITISPDVASSIPLPEGAEPGAQMQLTVTATLADDGSIILDSLEDVPLPDYEELAAEAATDEAMAEDEAAMAAETYAEEAPAEGGDEYGVLPSREELRRALSQR